MLGACGEGASTGHSVDLLVYTDFTPGADHDFDTVTLSLEQDGGEVRGGVSSALEDDKFRIGVHVGKFTSIQNGTYTLRVRLTQSGASASDSAVAERAVSITVDADLEVPILLPKDDRYPPVPFAGSNVTQVRSAGFLSAARIFQLANGHAALALLGTGATAPTGCPTGMKTSNVVTVEPASGDDCHDGTTGRDWYGHMTSEGRLPSYSPWINDPSGTEPYMANVTMEDFGVVTDGECDSGPFTFEVALDGTATFAPAAEANTIDFTAKLQFGYANRYAGACEDLFIEGEVDYAGKVTNFDPSSSAGIWSGEGKGFLKGIGAVEIRTVAEGLNVCSSGVPEGTASAGTAQTVVTIGADKLTFDYDGCAQGSELPGTPWTLNGKDMGLATGVPF